MSGVLWACLSESESKIATVADHGNSHDVEAGWSGGKQDSISCTKSVSGGGVTRRAWRRSLENSASPG